MLVQLKGEMSCYQKFAILNCICCTRVDNLSPLGTLSVQFSISKLCNVGAVERWDDLLISQSKVCLEKLSLMYKSPLGLYFNMQAIFKVQNVQCCCSAERGDEWPVDAEALASKKPLPWDSLETNTRFNWKPDTYWHGNEMHMIRNSCRLVGRGFQTMCGKTTNQVHFRVAELGSLSLGAKMAMKIFVKRVFTILQLRNRKFANLTQ